MLSRCIILPFQKKYLFRHPFPASHYKTTTYRFWWIFCGKLEHFSVAKFFYKQSKKVFHAPPSNCILPPLMDDQYSPTKMKYETHSENGSKSQYHDKNSFKLPC